CITAMKISFFYDCFLSWEVGGFFYHEYFFSNILFIFHALTCYYQVRLGGQGFPTGSHFFASNINQFDLYSSLVDNFSLEISKRLLETAVEASQRIYYEMIISLVFVYYVSFFCNIMFFAIFRNEDDSHIWKQLMVMCRFLENIEVVIAYDALELEHVKILVGITGGDIGSVGITGGDMIFCFCAPRNYARTRWSTSTLPSGAQSAPHRYFFMFSIKISGSYRLVLIIFIEIDFVYHESCICLLCFPLKCLVFLFCNIMSFDIFARGSSHIAWKQLMVMCRFLENSEVGNIGRVIIMFIHYQHNILVGITGGDMLNLGSVGITGGDIDIVNRGHVGLLLPYPLTSRPYSSIVAPNLRELKDNNNIERYKAK
ncbi:hypothetical protein ACJX0J_021314, partial [Zea mays]